MNSLTRKMTKGETLLHLLWFPGVVALGFIVGFVVACVRYNMQ